MKIRTVLAGALILLLNACATAPQQSASPVAGTWSNSAGTVWTIKPDGTFAVELNQSGKADITGRYVMKDDMFTISHNTGQVPKGCDTPGVYKFKRTGDTLTFSLVSDHCKDRKKNVLRPWHKK
jgi:hypothetical protein